MKKDIEWLKREIPNLRGYAVVIDDEDGKKEPITTVSVKDVLELIDQLDEPEVLMQELPVIPKLVANWIEEVKPDNSLRVAFEYIAQQKRDNHDDELAFWVEEGNSETFARAWLDGFTVEEEQRYYVDLETAAYVAKWGGDGSVQIYTDSVSGSDEYELHLTEQEIKDYDERFWSFAVKVEELKE